MSEDKKIPAASVGSSSDNPFKSSSMERRGFFKWLSLGWLAFAGATGGFFTVMIRFLFPNVLFEPPQTFKIGFPDDYSTNAVDISYKKIDPFFNINTREDLEKAFNMIIHD